MNPVLAEARNNPWSFVNYVVRVKWQSSSKIVDSLWPFSGLHIIEIHI
jgi:hypothetical protein